MEVHSGPGMSKTLYLNHQNLNFLKCFYESLYIFWNREDENFNLFLFFPSIEFAFQKKVVNI